MLEALGARKARRAQRVAVGSHASASHALGPADVPLSKFLRLSKPAQTPAQIARYVEAKQVAAICSRLDTRLQPKVPPSPKQLAAYTEATDTRRVTSEPLGRIQITLGMYRQGPEHAAMQRGNEAAGASAAAQAHANATACLFCDGMFIV